MTIEQPPEGMGFLQRRRWRNNQLRQLELDTASRAEALRGQGVDVAPSRGRIARAVAALWQRRILLMALALVVGLEVTITITQIPFYRALPMLRPEVAGVQWPVYVMLPIWTTSLSVYFGAAAGFVIQSNTGRYRRYLKLMWLFAGIGAVINVSHALALLNQAGADEWLTAVFLGGGSLFSPIVWHTYAAISLHIKIQSTTIADMLTISRQWARHPRLSWRCAQYLDLFPSLERPQVWEMVVRQSRSKALVKLGVLPAPVRVRETPVHWRKPSTWKRGTIVAPTFDDDAVLSALEVSLALPAAPDRVAQETQQATRKPADEKPVETTAEREYKRVWVAAAFYLMQSQQVPALPQRAVADVLKTTPGTVSKVFSACRSGEILSDSIEPATYAAVRASFQEQQGKQGKETADVAGN